MRVEKMTDGFKQGKKGSYILVDFLSFIIKNNKGKLDELCMVLKKTFGMSNRDILHLFDEAMEECSDQPKVQELVKERRERFKHKTKLD